MKKVLRRKKKKKELTVLTMYDKFKRVNFKNCELFKGRKGETYLMVIYYDLILSRK